MFFLSHIYEGYFLVIISSYSAVTSVASVSSLAPTIIAGSLRSLLSVCRQPQSQQKAADGWRWIVNSETTLHHPRSFSNSVFVLFLTTCYRLRQSRTMNELMNNLFSWNQDFFLQSVFLRFELMIHL